MANKVAIASSMDIDKLGCKRIWFPPTGRPYWVIAGKPNAGPDLTDEEIEKYCRKRKMYKSQKFKRGDVVHIAKKSMGSFETDKDVVIMYSYADRYSNAYDPPNTKDYSVMFLDDGHEVSWYEEHQLTFKYHGGEELISKILKKREKKENVK